MENEGRGMKKFDLELCMGLFMILGILCMGVPFH